MLNNQISEENPESVIYTKESLIRDLRNSGINPKGTLLVHSSMKAMGECENRGDTVIDAFIEFMQDGLLIFPTHTWDDINEKHNIYDPLTEPSCVGVLTNLFRKRKGVLRSLHPTHSLAAIGKDAEEFIKGEELTRTPCSRNGCYGKLYDRRAQILFLGCNLSKNTFLHCVEEWNNIPDRLAETTQELFVKTADGLISCPQYRHHSSVGDVSENYIKMEEAFIKTGMAKYCKIGNARSVLCEAAGVADLVSHCLRKKLDLFSNCEAVSDELCSDFI